jgi:hypothetical protein
MNDDESLEIDEENQSSKTFENDEDDLMDDIEFEYEQNEG